MKVLAVALIVAMWGGLYMVESLLVYPPKPVQPSDPQPLAPLDEPVYLGIDPAPGIPWERHAMWPPTQGVILGRYSPNFPTDNNTATACWWEVSTGERHDLTGAIEVDGKSYTPRLAEKGVDPATGATVWRCRSDDGEWVQGIIILPIGRTADFNDDGTVDTRDYTAFLNAWSKQRAEQP